MHRASGLLAVFIALVWIPTAHAQPSAVRVSLEGGTLIPSPAENPCPGSSLLINHDYGFHCGYAWQYGGVAPPYYGAFAEQFDGSGTLCGMQYVFTTLQGYYTGQTFDAYAWDADEGIPGAVLGVTIGLQPMTNIAPGIGYPTGWHDVAYIWGPTWSMGIGAYLDEGVTPVESVTWGRLKTLWK